MRGRTRALRREYDEFEYPVRRMARRGDRWFVRRSPRGTWLAGPKGINVFVDPALLHRYFEFPSWSRALQFACAQAKGRR